MDQLPRLGKRELICLLLFTCKYEVSVRRGCFPGENDGQMTMEYHGLPLSTMVVHGHTTMVYHG